MANKPPDETTLLVCRDYMLEHWQPPAEDEPLTFVDAFRKHLPSYYKTNMGIPRFTWTQAAMIDQFVPNLRWVSKKDCDGRTTKNTTLSNWPN